MADNPPGSDHEPLELEIRQSGDKTVVTCRGRITGQTINKFHDNVKALLPHTKSLILDLWYVTHLDSDGLGALVGIYISAQRAGCELRLFNVSDPVMQVLKLTKVATLFGE